MKKVKTFFITFASLFFTYNMDAFPDEEVKSLLNNKIDIMDVINAEKPRSFEYGAVFGDIMCHNVDKTKLEKNIVDFLKIGLWYYKEDTSLEDDISNVLDYLQSLPTKYEEYGFKSSLLPEEIKSLESQFHSISESHSSTTSSEKSSGSTSPKL